MEVVKTTDKVQVKYDNQNFSFEIIENNSNGIKLKSDSGEIHFLQHASINQKTTHLFLDGEDFVVRDDSSNKKGAGGSAGSLLSPMPGKVFKVLVKVGETVKSGQSVMIVEAMKMEHPIKAPKDGVVKKILFTEGSLVSAAAELLVIE
jgi:3-methylcrotonyl-CoA carboxylase alpha subunit